MPDLTTVQLNDEHFAELKAVLGEQAFMNAILRVELRRATTQAQARPEELNGTPVVGRLVDYQRSVQEARGQG